MLSPNGCASSCATLEKHAGHDVTWATATRHDVTSAAQAVVQRLNSTVANLLCNPLCNLEDTVSSLRFLVPKPQCVLRCPTSKLRPVTRYKEGRYVRLAMQTAVRCLKVTTEICRSWEARLIGYSNVPQTCHECATRKATTQKAPKNQGNAPRTVCQGTWVTVPTVRIAWESSNGGL